MIVKYWGLTATPLPCAFTPLPCALQGKRYIKKHLFSDTDTDQPKTDISWLRDSSRKPKPKVTDYTRKATKTAKITARAPDTTGRL